MSEKNRIKIAMLTELVIMIIMLLNFIYEANKLFQFFSLFLALMSCGFLFEHHRKLKELKE